MTTSVAFCKPKSGCFHKEPIDVLLHRNLVSTPAYPQNQQDNQPISINIKQPQNHPLTNYPPKPRWPSPYTSPSASPPTINKPRGIHVNCNTHQPLTTHQSTSPSMTSILVINPNSSVSVSENLRSTVAAPPGVTLEYYTAPLDAPPEISGTETLIQSEQASLPDILQKNLLDKYDGFLVACYSDHPLVYSLAKHTSKPVLGIMQATLLYSYANARARKLFVLTSTSGWLPLLDDAITKVAGAGTFPYEKFQKTRALDVLVLNLSDASEFLKITDRLELFLREYAEDHIDCVLLGCAGMAGLDEKLRAKFPSIVFIDSVKAGVEFLVSLTRLGQ